MRADPGTRSELRKRRQADLAANAVRLHLDRALSGGNDSSFPAHGDVEAAHRRLARDPIVQLDPHRWTADQRRAFNVLAHDFGFRHGERFAEWHREHGTGGTTGLGSGLSFLLFHHRMMKSFRESLGPTPTGGWNPATPVPRELTDPTGRRENRCAAIGTPNWLSTSGSGSSDGNRDFGAEVTIDRRTFRRLWEFEDPDDLGRALGESGYQLSAHVRLGGIMSSLRSPCDAAFYLWYGHLESLFGRWLRTAHGLAWKESVTPSR
jgi:hypothetical protein